ncbi:MAG: response regulator [Candidatus Omnitrophica bacterium]|nr:response regulator [Candidatus Omnitrophota bacterium]
MAKRVILIVDDEAEFVELMQMRLEANGYEVITANNGKAAIERVEKDKPDAILLDIMMPEIDGLSVLKEVRSKDAKLPVFIITAFSNEEKVKTASKLNASGFIVKTQDLGREVKNITAAIEIYEKFKGKHR